MLVLKKSTDWDIFTMAVRDEAGCAIVEPILYRRFRRGRSFIGFNTRRAKGQRDQGDVEKGS